jgi:hypothetical protein
MWFSERSRWSLSSFWLDFVLPISKHLIHDAWIAVTIAAVSKIQCINEPLIQYRQHAGQQIGDRDSWRNRRTQWQAARKMSLSHFREQQLFFGDLASRLDQHQSRWVQPRFGELAKHKMNHLERRIQFREHRIRSLAGIAKEYASGKYSKFSYGWKSAAQDLLL